MKLLSVILAVAALTLSIPAAAVTLDNSGSTGGSIDPYGPSQTTTYGTVFTAPITGFLTNFKLYTGGSSFVQKAYVANWNGPATYGTGYGPTAILFTSGTFSSNSTPSFATSVAVTAGSQYVVFASVAGLGGSGNESWPLAGANVAGIDYFVWDNGSTPGNLADGSWNYFFHSATPAKVTLDFTAGVPEPASWALMIAGFGMIGAASRRRRNTVAA